MYDTAFPNNILFKDEGVEYHLYDGIYSIPHDHAGLWECFIMMQGKAVHVCNGSHEPIERGFFGVLRPQDRHHFAPADSPVSPQHVSIAILDAHVRKVLDSIDGAIYGDLLHYPGNLTMQLNETQVNAFFSNMQELFYTPFNVSHYVSNLLKFKFIDLISIMLTAKLKKGNSYPPIVRKIIETFYAEGNAEKSVDALCREFSYSHAQLLRIFKKATGKTLVNFFTDLKLDKAYNLLLSTNSKILDICQLVGFDSISYFNQKFKERYKMTPSALRRSKST